MATQIQLGDIAVDVVLKDIKNVHLSVHPPTGRVRISAPQRMSLDTIRVFAISKLAGSSSSRRSCGSRSAKRRASIWTGKATTSGASATCSTVIESDGAAVSRAQAQPHAPAGAARELARKSDRPSLRRGIASSSRKPCRH